VNAFDVGWGLVKEKGININDSKNPYTDMILSGKKTVETRRKPTLDPYIGRKVGIIRTGKGPAKLVGYAKVGKPRKYGSKSEFDSDRRRHRVPSDSKEEKSSGYGYPLSEVKRVKPRNVKSRGIVSREI
tara:strand:+ start:166 stop:552 length:387 start_codon:yes stop_codon:yes gene_type:complete